MSYRLRFSADSHSARLSCTRPRQRPIPMRAHALESHATRTVLLSPSQLMCSWNASGRATSSLVACARHTALPHRPSPP